jgi:ATP-dependent DNA helicase RecG
MRSAFEQLQAWMNEKEAERLEFKEAKLRYDFEELVKYCVALANEGGGKIILGVTDKRPRKVVSTQAFTEIERTKAGLIERLRLRPRKLQVESPGGLPPGITLENILWRQDPRNRRIAETFGRCGLVERAGQGMNLIYGACIKESKPLPDFTGTDDYQVCLTLHGEMQDPRFLRFLEQVGRETVASFTTQDLLVLDLVHREQRIPADLKPRLSGLVDAGVIEPAGQGKFMLSRRLYGFLGQRGVYTRKRGLDRETNKALLLKHIEDNREEGSRLEELMQVLPALSRDQVQTLLKELKKAGRIHCVGRTNAGRWYPGPAPL